MHACVVAVRATLSVTRCDVLASLLVHVSLAVWLAGCLHAGSHNHYLLCPGNVTWRQWTNGESLDNLAVTICAWATLHTRRICFNHHSYLWCQAQSRGRRWTAPEFLPWLVAVTWCVSALRCLRNCMFNYTLYMLMFLQLEMTSRHQYAVMLLLSKNTALMDKLLIPLLL